MGAPDAVLDLVERFARNREQYLNPAYNETQVRREFIDPFFEALGWDVDNTRRLRRGLQGRHPRGRDQGRPRRPKRPTTRFRIGGTRKFFVEAKKPSVNLKDDPARPTSSAATPGPPSCRSRILTDFEEFAVYDCRVQPGDDRQGLRRAHPVPHLRRLRRRAGTRSPASSPRRPSSRAPSTSTPSRPRRKKGTAEVDDAFLARSRAGATRWPATSPCATRAHAARAQLRRAGDHRPHHLPAHLRGPRHRGLRPPAGAR